ncbi:MAG: class II fructose-bisphosphate aldolase [Fretibacterium sp.]|nr:class II fructose-bisphosphate aldolase [Fretibacterium sp.]
MRVSVSALLQDARRRGYAVPGFNTLNVETAWGIVRAAEKLDIPILLMTAYDCLDHLGMETAYGALEVLARQSATPVALHLDHGRNLEEVALALKLGYDSVMIDYSFLPYEENLARTAEAVRMAHAFHTPIEAEIGHVPGGENTPEEEDESALAYTDPKVAADFVEKTGVDFLAVSIGTVHGDYKSKPRLRIDLLKEIARAVPLPLVLHGGSSTPWEQMEEAVQNGVAKINVGTEIMRAFLQGMREVPTDCLDLRKPLLAGREKIEDVVRAKAENFRTLRHAKGWRPDRA